MTQPFQKESNKFADRLRAALKDAGIRVSATVVANEFNLRYWGEGISSHAARNWLMGVSVPKQDKLMVISKWLKISPEGLLFGTPPPRPVDETLKDERINLVDQQLISRYFTLQPEHRRVVRDVVEGLAALNPKMQSASK
jgi:transcriptional regulator with XRE-family HTH domain